MARRCTTATPIGVGLIMWSVCVAAPVSGSTLLVSNTFDHFADTPDLIRLMSIENIHCARHLKKSTLTPCSVIWGLTR